MFGFHKCNQSMQMGYFLLSFEILTPSIFVKLQTFPKDIFRSTNDDKPVWGASFSNNGGQTTISLTACFHHLGQTNVPSKRFYTLQLYIYIYSSNKTPSLKLKIIITQ